MEKNELDFGFSLDELDTFLKENALKFLLYPDLIISCGKISDYNIAYKLVGTQQMKPIKGSTVVKSASRVKLESYLLSIGRPAAGVFFDLGKFDLQEQVKCTPAGLSALRGGRLIAKSNITGTVCTENLADLIGVNITAPKLTILATLTSDFEKNNIVPNTKIKARADIGKEVTTLQKEIRSFINNVFTNQMYVFVSIDSPFFLSYEHIVTQIHTGIRHETPTIPTTIKTFHIFSQTTNQDVAGAIIQAFELPGSGFSDKNGLVRKLIIPVGQCTIQVRAFGFQDYSQLITIDPANNNYIQIALIPTVTPS